MGLPQFGYVEGFVDDIREIQNETSGKWSAYVKLIVQPTDKDRNDKWSPKGSTLFMDLFIYEAHDSYRFIVDEFAPWFDENDKKQRKVLHCSEVGYYRTVNEKNGKTYINDHLQAFPWSRFSDERIVREGSQGGGQGRSNSSRSSSRRSNSSSNRNSSGSSRRNVTDEMEVEDDI